METQNSYNLLIFYFLLLLESFSSYSRQINVIWSSNIRHIVVKYLLCISYGGSGSIEALWDPYNFSIFRILINHQDFTEKEHLLIYNALKQRLHVLLEMAVKENQ